MYKNVPNHQPARVAMAGQRRSKFGDTIWRAPKNKMSPFKQNFKEVSV